MLILSFSFSFKKKSIGPLIRDILQNIENLVSNKGQGRKAKIYSGVC
jgi:hypothetical protein